MMHSLEDQGSQLSKDKRFEKFNSIAHNVTMMHIVLVVGVPTGTLPTPPKIMHVG